MEVATNTSAPAAAAALRFVVAELDGVGTALQMLSLAVILQPLHAFAVAVRARDVDPLLAVLRRAHPAMLQKG